MTAVEPVDRTTAEGQARGPVPGPGLGRLSALALSVYAMPHALKTLVSILNLAQQCFFLFGEHQNCCDS